MNKSHYQGKTTRLQNRINKLEIDLRKFNYLRWRIVPKAVAKLLATSMYEHFGIPIFFDSLNQSLNQQKRATTLKL